MSFVICVYNKSEFLISFEKGIDCCEFDVLEAMLLYFACQIVAIGPRVLLGCFLANVNVQLEVLNSPEEPVDARVILITLSDSNREQLFGVASLFEILEDRVGDRSQSLPGLV